MGLLKASHAVGQEHQTCSKTASWETQTEKEEKTALYTSFQASGTCVCLSGTVHHLGLLTYHLVTLKPTHREILSGAERGQANAKNLGTEKPRVLPVFPITCSRQENTAGINILLPGANCKMVCAKLPFLEMLPQV